MTFHSLYRLEARKLLDCPIIGVAGDDWTIEQLRDRCPHLDRRLWGNDRREGVRAARRGGSPMSPGTSAKPGHLRAAARRRSATPGTPVFYLEVPPSLFGMVIGHLSGADLTLAGPAWWSRSRSATTSLSARALAEEIHQYIDESQLYRIDHFLGKMGTDELLYLRFEQHHDRADLEPQPHRARWRSRWPRTSGSRTGATSTTRSVRCATWSSTTSCSSSPWRPWRRPPVATRKRSRTPSSPCSARSRPPTRPTTCAASTTATARSTASPRTPPPRHMPRCA